MKAPLRKLWDARAPRERTVIAVLAAILGIASYLWLAQSGDHARAQLRSKDATLLTDAARLDQQAGELERLRAAPPAALSSSNLQALVQARIDASGLSSLLLRIDAPDANHVKV
jgi:type II secretory pathway component PulM